MTHLGALGRWRERGARPRPARELRTLPGPVTALVLHAEDIPLLLAEALNSGKPCSETVAGEAFAKPAVRWKLRRIGGGRGRPLSATKNVNAIVRIPPWRYVTGGLLGPAAGGHVDEMLALLALWTGEGTTPQSGQRVLNTAYRPRSPQVQRLLGWHEIGTCWTQDQLELLNTLLRDGTERSEAIEIARHPGW